MNAAFRKRKAEKYVGKSRRSTRVFCVQFEFHFYPGDYLTAGAPVTEIWCGIQIRKRLAVAEVTRGRNL